MLNKSNLFFLFIFFSLPYLLLSQVLVSGKVTDERNDPIPYAKVFIKNMSDQRTVSDINGYFELRLMPGEYFLVFNSTGFQERESYVTVTDRPVQKDIQLFPSTIKDFQDMDIQSKKTNPGREIMLKVVEKKDKISLWNYPHTVDVYIKASEKLDRKEKTKKDPKKDVPDEPFEDDTKKAADLLAENMNLAEAQITRHYSPSDKVKEIRNAYELRGTDRNLYYTTTAKANFNFFENLLRLDDLHQNPIMSPISSPGILSYKYRIESKYQENGKNISKIKISSRNIATSTLEGYIYVIDSLWLIQKLELTMEKGNLLIYDFFTIYQEFDHIGDTLCVLTKQDLKYGVKYKNETSAANTNAVFSNYNFKPNFSDKFFGAEVAVTEKEAYEKDSTYWANTRQGVLTEEEKRFILVKDSIFQAQNRKEYLDSVDSIFNKITFLKVVWFGIDHRNRSKRNQYTFASLASLIQPMFIGGPRINPWVDYFKKWKDERTLDSYTQISYGFLNRDIKGDTWWKYRFDPFHFGTVRWSFNHGFDVIRGYDAITQIYKRDNFIEVTKMRIAAEYELFNGFYIDFDNEFSERRSLKNFKFLTWLDNAIPNNEPLAFQTYQALVSDITLIYTPRQKYMREPYRKVLLGSAWPTFYLNYERGIPKLFGSDVDHEYLQFSLAQTFKIGTLGTTSYRGAVGKFLSARNLRDPDYKFQRRSDPIWFSNPLYSFQGLDSTLPTIDYSMEFHVVHHDNGAIINKIPFMKKTRIGMVAGAGLLYVKEYNWLHYEAVAGLERNFKISRRRLRLGVYGVVSDGNNIPMRAAFKVSFAFLDDRNMKWNF
ncbi:MAG: hypothetical protein RLZ10_1467 [Bacteroidota bacterium]|jgi:hypothetical protein